MSKSPAPLPAASVPLPGGSHRLRSGTAARLAGLPVTTLRVWERRYGVVAAVKTQSGQRMYSPHDVARLRLLRQLTHAGHAIGTIAALELDALQVLAEGLAGAPDPAPMVSQSVVAVGRSAALALEALPGCLLRASHEDLDRAEAAAPLDEKADALVIRVASLQPAVVLRVLALARKFKTARTFVIYAFGTEASARALRDAGVTVHREPVSGRELAQWLRHGRDQAPALPLPPAPPAAGASQVQARRFSDDDLARLAAMPSVVDCECLRHMAEIVTQLAGFERYSQECTSAGPDDAALHRQLAQTAGAARTLFETALARVVRDEGLELSNATI